jgi:hypothetical protein
MLRLVSRTVHALASKAGNLIGRDVLTFGSLTGPALCLSYARSL